MLVLCREVDQDIVIGDGVVVRVVRIKGDKVWLGIEAPSHVSIDRREVRERKLRDRVGDNRYPHEPDYAVAPGETLRETLGELSATLFERSVDISTTAREINDIINGIKPITPEFAVSLASMTGIPSRMWLNLEANYREQLAKTKGGGK